MVQPAPEEAQDLRSIGGLALAEVQHPPQHEKSIGALSAKASEHSLHLGEQRGGILTTADGHGGTDGQAPRQSVLDLQVGDDGQCRIDLRLGVVPAAQPKVDVGLHRMQGGHVPTHAQFLGPGHAALDGSGGLVQPFAPQQHLAEEEVGKVGVGLGTRRVDGHPMSRPGPVDTLHQVPTQRRHPPADQQAGTCRRPLLGAGIDALTPQRKLLGPVKLSDEQRAQPRVGQGQGALVRWQLPGHCLEPV